MIQGTSLDAESDLKETVRETWRRRSFSSPSPQRWLFKFLLDVRRVERLGWSMREDGRPVEMRLCVCEGQREKEKAESFLGLPLRVEISRNHHQTEELNSPPTLLQLSDDDENNGRQSVGKNCEGRLQNAFSGADVARAEDRRPKTEPGPNSDAAEVFGIQDGESKQRGLDSASVSSATGRRWIGLRLTPARETEGKPQAASRDAASTFVQTAALIAASGVRR
ncbi:hypothetical protein C8R44DRAFT_749846 [Mycena epipterygia]|nr:hypothetical protein C8R44DRAFT_749846 [Mycena epipterygia]